jgi:hypothetical protein
MTGNNSLECELETEKLEQQNNLVAPGPWCRKPFVDIALAYMLEWVA